MEIIMFKHFIGFILWFMVVFIVSHLFTFEYLIAIFKRNDIQLNIFFVLFFRFGPHFEDVLNDDDVINATALSGKTAYLNCRISLLQDKTVSYNQMVIFFCILIFNRFGFLEFILYHI